MLAKRGFKSLRKGLQAWNTQSFVALPLPWSAPTNPRENGGKNHPLIEMIFLILRECISDAESWTA
jgi:hypothetical protein